MTILKSVKRGRPLALLSLVEYGTPFLRMIALSRLLPLRELGFTSALSATFATFNLLSDFGAHRFVLSAPREDFEEALASIHALTFLRGMVIGACGVALAPLIAATFSLSADWASFALMAVVYFIGSFEHLGPRADERNYHYRVQLRVTLIANGLGLGALLITLALVRSHEAIISSLFATAIGQVAASQLLADTPYRMNFRSRYFRQAFRFGYPLMINGLGLAATSQGDRFIVGSFLGLPTLGLYSVATLVTLVPMNVVFRFVSTFMLAALYNVVQRNDGSYAARLRLAAGLLPLVGAVDALGIVTLLNIVMPLVFGRQFTLSPASVAFLALGAFFRISRAEPFTAILMQQGRTRRLAACNLASSSALLYEVVLVILFGTFEAVIAGRLLGEITGWAVGLFLTRVPFLPARRDFYLSMTLGGAGVIMVVGLSFVTPIGQQLAPSIAALAACVAIFLAWAFRFAPPVLRLGYSKRNAVAKAEHIAVTGKQGQ